VSQTVTAIVSVLIGSLAASLLGRLNRDSAKHATRTSALEAVRGEFATAQRLIAAAKKASGLWPPTRTLCGDAWGTHGLQLLGFLGTAEGRQLQKTRELLDGADKRVARVQLKAREGDPMQVVPEKLHEAIDALEGHLRESLKILDEALEDAQSELRRARAINLGGKVAIALAVIAGIAFLAMPAISGGPAVTSSSVADSLEAELPGSDLTICDKSTVLEGVYRCAVEFSGCDGQFEASTAEPSCPAPREKGFKVITDEECFEAILTELTEGGATASDPLGEPEREEVHAGCIE
jgi:hypothetical protein